jgi:CheY-like chemotaxis protein
MSKTLLLADDSSTIQRVVELTFAEEDIRVVAVDDGEQALLSIERDQPDIVLADVGMPRLDGYSVSSHVKTSPQLQHIPVLLLAGAFEPIDEDRARAARCDGVLVKPFEPRLLVSRVQELLEAAHARQAVAAPGRATPSGDGATSTGESARVVLAWPKPERADAHDRPAPPSFDASDIDRRLAALAPAPVVRTMPADPITSTAAPATASLIVDPESVPPGHGAPAASLVVLEPPVPQLRLDPVSMPARSPKPVTAAPAPVLRPAAAATTPTMAPAGGSLGSKVSLATAFAALLAAEQSAPIAGDLPDGLGQSAVEDVVRRVLLSDGAVRKIVHDAAERMVREEIERIKSSPPAPAEGGPLTE